MMDIETTWKTSKIPKQKRKYISLVTLSHLICNSQIAKITSKFSLSLSHSIFLKISYILQWLVCSILQKLFNTFFVTHISSKMQRCLSKWFKNQNFPTNSVHTSCEEWHLSHQFGWEIYTLSPFLHITSITPSFLLLSQLSQLLELHRENEHKTYSLKYIKVRI